MKGDESQAVAASARDAVDGNALAAEVRRIARMNSKGRHNGRKKGGKRKAKR